MDNKMIKNILLIASGLVAVKVVKEIRDYRLQKEINDELDNVIEIEEVDIDEK